MSRRAQLLAYATGRTEAPVSYEQEWMLYLTRMRRTGTFNMPRLYRAGPGRSVDELVAAVESVAAGDGALRTRFERRGGGFVQSVTGSPAPTEIIEVGGRDPATTRAQAAARIGEFVRRPLDPFTGPVFRCAVAPVPGGGHLLATVVHHCVADAVTLDEIERRILHALDPGGAAGGPAGGAIACTDYAAWQRATYDPVLPELLERAAARLRDCAPTLLPGVGPRSRIPGRADSGSFGLERVDGEAFRALLAEERASPFMAGLTALAAALQAMTGREGVLVAVEMSTRRMSPLLAALGPFISTVPVEVRGAGSFRSRLRATRETVLEAMDRAHLPYHRLLGHPGLRAMRRGSEHAVDVVYQTFHEEAAPGGEDAALRRLDYGMEGAGFTADLHVSLHESPHERRLGIGHSPRVPRALVGELAGRLETVLSNGVLDPDAPVNARVEAHAQ